MCPRPRSRSDSSVIEAAARVVGRRGALHTRLSDVAAEAGLAPATLVQRFGSRERLLQAVGESYVRGLAESFGFPADAHLDRLVGGLGRLAVAGQLDLVAELPQAARAYSAELRKQIGLALAAAAQAGEVSPIEVARHARDIQLRYYGILSAARLEGEPVAESDFGMIVRDALADYL